MSKYRAYGELRPFSRTSRHHGFVLGSQDMWFGTKSTMWPSPWDRRASHQPAYSASDPSSGLSEAWSPMSYPCVLPGTALRSGEL